MITAQVESFESAAPELRGIFPVHWRELALFKDRVQLAPQWNEYVKRERDGTLFLTTVRRDGQIVAYYIAQVAPGFHYGDTLTAHLDIVYVIPEFRDRGSALPLFRCVERELRRRGVKVWYSGWKTNSPLDMDRLLNLLGFQPADTLMAKWIGT